MDHAGEAPTASLVLTDQQRQIADPALRGSLFVSGSAGAGKTTAAVHRLRRLLESGVRADSILVLLPQRTLVRPYREALRDPALAAGAAVAVTTVGGLAKRVVELFWPLVAADAGFAEPEREPVFLTMETAQYYMARVMQPLLRDGCFDALAIDRNRIYSQVLDNLNKSAVVGFDHLTIGDRLRAACGGDPVQERVYRDVQTCATAFRRFCLEHELLDFSLQMELFARHLMAVQPARRYLVRLHRHLIADNVEEDTPVAHDLLLSWLGEFASAVVICDDDAGYRRFLGADPEDGLRLRDACDAEVRMDRLPESDPSLPAFERRLAWHLQPPSRRPDDGPGRDPFPVGGDGVLRFAHHRYYPEMLDWVAKQIAGLIAEGVAPGEIVVLAPFLSDALRFALVDRLDRLGVPARSHRPSRALREEPATRCLLTLAALAHPSWRLTVAPAELAHALVDAIDGLDLVRARVLADALFDPAQSASDLAASDLAASGLAASGSASAGGALRPFASAPAGVHERVTYTVGGRYEGLRVWIDDYRTAAAVDRLDHFLRRLFGELLSQPGYGFHHARPQARDHGQVAAQLVESVRKFRWVTERQLAEAGESSDREYAATVADGLIAAQYVDARDADAEEAVLLTPAWTFLMSNRRVDHQFWIEVGARGWSEPMQQPLTQPYVLSRGWPAGRAWGEEDEAREARDHLYRLAVGLVRRCRTAIHLGLCDVNEQGSEYRGRFLRAIDTVLRSAQAA